MKRYPAALVTMNANQDTTRPHCTPTDAAEAERPELTKDWPGCGSLRCSAATSQTGGEVK